MKTCRMICAAGLFVALAATALAKADTFGSRAEAIAATFPNRDYVEWISIEGDLNGDGINDIAMVLSPKDGPAETRVVVLAGAPGGRFSVLSVSSRYCVAQKFFNLTARGSSLFVIEVNKADADGEASDTRHFRFNRRLGDMELIGTENTWESFTDKSNGRRSVNYLTGTAIDYERVRGRVLEKARSHFEVRPPARLHGFDCDAFFADGPE